MANRDTWFDSCPCCGKDLESRVYVQPRWGEDETLAYCADCSAVEKHSHEQDESVSRSSWNI